MGATEPSALRDIITLARSNGLHLTEAEAEELRPAYEQMRRWQAKLRELLESSEAEEPATHFEAGRGTADGL